MPKKVISYTLTPEGTVPDYVEDGGYFPNNDVLIGVSKEGSTLPSSTGVFENQASLVSYLNTYTHDWVNSNFATNTHTPFNSLEAAQVIFEKAL